MLDVAFGPFLFDTSADAWFSRNASPEARQWMLRYLSEHRVNVSAITVFERVRGFTLLRGQASRGSKAAIEVALALYLADPGQVWPMDALVASIAAEMSALVPDPPTPPRRAHRIVESRATRVARWRADTMIAATALAQDMLLLHNNAADFEALRTAVELSPERFLGLGPLKLMRCAAVL